jgi:hypothetical protein
MWIFALEGFVSVVALKGSADRLVVRGRVKIDIQTWHKWAGSLSRGGKVKHTPKADYPWRFVTTRKAFAGAIERMVTEGLQYGNFKGVVGHDDPERADAYMDVWSVMRRLQQGVETRVSTTRVASKRYGT